MAESQADHRRALEKRVIDGDINRAKWGLILGFLVALLFLLASVYMVTSGYLLAGIIIGTVDIVGLVSAFIAGTVARRRDLERRQRGIR